MNLIEGLQGEMKRVRDLQKEYEGLPDGAGKMGAAIMAVSLSKAERSIEKGDVVFELQCYEELKAITG